MSNTVMPVICIMWCLVNWGPKWNHFFIKKNFLKHLMPKMIFYWKKNHKQIKKCKLVLPLNFDLYVNFKDSFLFQNGLFLFYWHHLAISTLVSVSLSWSLSRHHYDTYSCCSICFQKPVRGDWVGWWTVFCPYSLEGRPAQSCTRSDLYLISAQAIFFHHKLFWAVHYVCL